MRARFFCAALAVLAACGGPTTPAGDPVGAYKLQTVDGHGLPFRIVTQPGIEIVDRRVVLSPDGSFSDALDLRVYSSAGALLLPRERRGTFSGSPPHLTLSYDSGRSSSAKLDGAVLELDDRGVTFRLKR